MKFYGNKQAIDQLRIASLYPLSSYVLLGDKGLGKATLGKHFAKRLLCFSGEQNCNCLSCLRFESGNHPDFIEIKPEKSVIKIDQIREAKEQVYRAPILSKRKIFFVDDADYATTEAQNALLKTLEESFEYVTFIFIAHRELLSTIQSRSTIIEFKPLSPEVISNSIENVSEDIIKELLVAGTKGVGRAKVLLEDEDFIKQARDFINLLSNMCSISCEDLLEGTGLLKEKDNNNIFNDPYLCELLNIAYTFIFDVIRYKVKDKKRIVFNSLKERVFPQYDYLSLKSVDKMSNLLYKALAYQKKKLLTKDDLLLLFINLRKEAELCQ
jgi:DNA polymerase-3 subunit delta'